MKIQVSPARHDGAYRHDKYSKRLPTSITPRQKSACCKLVSQRALDTRHHLCVGEAAAEKDNFEQQCPQRREPLQRVVPAEKYRVNAWKGGRWDDNAVKKASAVQKLRKGWRLALRSLGGAHTDTCRILSDNKPTITLEKNSIEVRHTRAS